MFDFLDPSDEHERCGYMLIDEADEDDDVLRVHDFTHRFGERVRWYVGMIVELPNTHEDPKDHFRISQSDLTASLRWLKRDESDIIGFWHSHTADHLPGPSQHDWDEIALGDKQHWHCVVHPDTRNVTWFDYHGNSHSETDIIHQTVQVPVRTVVRQLRKTQRR